MKKLSISLVFSLAFTLLGAHLAMAQAPTGPETYSLSTGSGQQGTRNAVLVDKGRAIRNRTTCKRLNLVSTCTQSQACVAANAPGGASCTAAQARQVNVRIFPQTLAGREEFIMFHSFVPDLVDFFNQTQGQDNSDACTSWSTMTQAQRDVVCAAFIPALPAGCDLCR